MLWELRSSDLPIDRAIDRPEIDGYRYPNLLVELLADQITETPNTGDLLVALY